MKKIFYSAGVIAFIGALSLGATGAFFSDTETSTGNTFTAGAIDLKVDSEQHYNGMVCTSVGEGEFEWQPEPNFVPGPDQYPVAGTPCDGTWELIDLDTVAHKFFNFGDVKPADQGENTVSLHIDNNPAWACVDIKTTGDNENTLIEPETTAGDVTPLAGELAQNIHVFAWLDNASTTGAVAGDNIWQAGETVLQQPVALSALNSTTTLTLADGGTGTPLPGGSTSYVGLGWCAGDLLIGAPGSWSCDGSTMGNTAQTDSATTTVAFRVEQSRNNSGFRCQPLVEEVVLPPQI
jgi:predicted ribosomally synthesized peptide with SipW-like signal peptide